MQDQDRVSRLGDLIAYLHAHPLERNSPDDIAEKLGFEATFVARVIAGLEKEPIRRNQSNAQRRNWIKEGGNWLKGTVDRWPLLYIALSVVVFIGALVAIPAQNSPRTLLLLVGLFFGLAAFQGYMYFRQASPMLPFKMALIGFIPMLGASILSILHGKNDPSLSQSMQIGLMVFAVVLLSIFYAGIYAAISAWGAVYKNKKKYRLASRHDLLQRYFEVSDRLKHAQTIPAKETLGKRLVEIYRAHPYLWAFSVGLFVTLGIAAAGLFYQQNPYETHVNVNGHQTLPFAYLLIMLPLGVLGLASFAFICFYAGGARKAVGVYLVNAIPNIVMNIVLSGNHTIEIMKFSSPGQRPSVVQASSLVSILISVCVNLCFAALIGGASQLAENNSREKRIMENDESALVAELFNLQMRLSEQPTRVCVLVVDAAGSTAMKADADALIAEFSFRRYQEWISKIVGQFGGRVEATAGDGAIVAFAEAKLAATAALFLQQDVARFNLEENKLDTPFRIRIGIHTGDVVADLAEVQFTRVIDIAAHIEKVSPVGGVAMTDAAAADLTGFTLTAMPDQVDGCQVFELSAAAV